MAPPFMQIAPFQPAVPQINAGTFAPVQNALMKYTEGLERQHQRNALLQGLQGLDMSPGEREMMAANPQMAQQVMGQVYQNRFDPMAKLRMQKAQTDLDMAPLERQRMEGQIAAQRAEVGMMPLRANLLRAQEAQARQKDEMNSAIARMLGGAGGLGDAPPAPGGNPMLQRQSMDGGAPADSNLILAQQAQPGAQQPQAPQMVQTPLGPMPKDKAQRLGLGLALAGKGDAGKMMADSANAGGLGKEAMNEVDKSLVNATNNLGMLHSISQQFRPEFQTIEKRIGMQWTALVDSLSSGRMQIRPEQLKELEDFSAFRADAFNALNQYIKSVTGAAMTEAEAQRIMKSMPNPGSGLFDGDSPTQFKAKLDAAMKQTTMAIARANYAKQTGKPWQYIGLNQMSGIVDQMGNDLAKRMRSEGVPDVEIRPRVREEIRRQLGIAI